jgi:hypothetical protein
MLRTEFEPTTPSLKQEKAVHALDCRPQCSAVGTHTIMLLKNTVFWDVMRRGSCKNRRFGGTYRLHHQGDKNQRTRQNVISI